jgi:large subunit ribosomal protein L10
MNPDKKIIINGLLDRVNASPYLIVIDYTGLTVQQFTELRNRLGAGGANCTVAKNSYMRKALAEAGMPDIGADLTGQMAYIMGDAEVFSAAKVIKNFEKEFKKPEMKVGILGNAILDAEALKSIADIPSREAVLSQLLATILEPATRIARVVQAKFNPDGDDSSSEKSSPAEAPVAEAEAAVVVTDAPVAEAEAAVVVAETPVAEVEAAVAVAETPVAEAEAPAAE